DFLLLQRGLQPLQFPLDPAGDLRRVATELFENDQNDARRAIDGCITEFWLRSFGDVGDVLEPDRRALGRDNEGLTQFLGGADLGLNSNKHALVRILLEAG